MARTTRKAAPNPVNAFRPMAFTHGSGTENRASGPSWTFETGRKWGGSGRIESNRAPPRIQSRPEHGHEREIMNRRFHDVPVSGSGSVPAAAPALTSRP